MGDPQYLAHPQLALAQSVFTLASPSTSSSAKQSSLSTLQDAIREHKMAPLYAYLAHPQTGKINPSGESGSAVMSPTISRSNTNMSSSGPPSNALRRTSSIKTPSMIGVLGGKTDTSVGLPWDEALYDELKADNEKELAAIAKEEEDATERAGETELLAAQSKRAELYARIGDKDAALSEFEKLFDKTGVLAIKIDI
ncbi:proteasome regulatory particle subunit, partial [Friedmanniomyces endolithicus]